jgi:cobalt/nickel transport system permease protein
MTLAFDALATIDSPLARIDPRWKLAALASSLVAASLLRDSRMVAVLLAFSMGLVLAARFTRKFLLTRLGAVLLFFAPFAIILPIQNGVTGFYSAITLTARALSIIFLALALVATSPFADVVKAAQAIGVPSLLTRIALLSYRYVFLLADDFARMRTSIIARGFRNRTNRHSYSTIGRVTGTLFVRSAERAERVAHAMACRGFDGRCRAMNGFHTRLFDIVFCVAITAVAAILVISDRLIQ